MSENISFLGNLWRLISFYKIRKALGLARAADEQFTSSAAGISDAYDIHHDSLVGDYKELLAAVSQVENAIEMKRGQLDGLEKKIAKSTMARDGAVRLYSEELAKGEKADPAVLTKHETNGAAFAKEVKAFTEQRDALKAQIQAKEPDIAKLESRLTAMQKEINDLPQEKAEKVAEFVSNKAIIDANARLNNLRTTSDRSPLDAVSKKLAEQAAEARVSSRMANTNASTVTDEYLTAGSEVSGMDEFKALVATRQAKKAETTGEAPVAASADHEKI